MLKQLLARLSSPRPAFVTALFILAIIGGSLAGIVSETASERLGDFVDPLVMLLVGTLFFTLRFEGWAALRRAPRTVVLALGLNFALVPVIAFVLTSLLVPDEALRLGVLIYCLFPCTDWFLGFTRLAGGDTAVGVALIPLQLILQLILFPVWIGIFTGVKVDTILTETGPELFAWFAVPAAIALALRLALLLLPVVVRRSILDGVDAAVLFVIAALIVALFGANIGTIQADLPAFGWVLLAVFVFFVVVYALGEGVSRFFRLDHASHVLLTMTTSARNAPLMLALTAIVLPDRPEVATAIVLGMLIEFPHLTAVTHLLCRKQRGERNGVDGRLVTGQNPGSAKETTRKVADLLN